MPGFLAVVLAKLAGVGTVAKAALAATTAALTMALAGGATGVLPLPGGHADAGVVTTALHQVVGANATTVPGTSNASGAPATPGASVTAGAGSTSTHAATTANASGGAASGRTASGGTGSGDTASGTGSTSASTTGASATGQVAGSAVPAVSSLVGTKALAALPSCVVDLIPTVGTRPDPVKLIEQLPACILSVIKERLPLDAVQGAIGSAHLPVNVFACLSSALKAAPTSATAGVSGLHQLLAACLPTGALASGGSASGGSLPGIGSVTGSAAHSGTRSGR